MSGLSLNMLQAAPRSVFRQLRCRARTSKVSYAFQSPQLARLLSSLAVLEQRDGTLNPSSLAAITAAREVGGSVTALVAGSNITPVAQEVAKVNDLSKVIKIDNGAYDKVDIYTVTSLRSLCLCCAGSSRKLCSYAR